jgi:hypothetical protein
MFTCPRRATSAGGRAAPLGDDFLNIKWRQVGRRAFTCSRVDLADLSVQGLDRTAHGTFVTRRTVSTPSIRRASDPNGTRRTRPSRAASPTRVPVRTGPADGTGCSSAEPWRPRAHDRSVDEPLPEARPGWPARRNRLRDRRERQGRLSPMGRDRRDGHAAAPRRSSSWRTSPLQRQSRRRRCRDGRRARQIRRPRSRRRTRILRTRQAPKPAPKRRRRSPRSPVSPKPCRSGRGSVSGTRRAGSVSSRCGRIPSGRPSLATWAASTRRRRRGTGRSCSTSPSSCRARTQRRSGSYCPSGGPIWTTCSTSLPTSGTGCTGTRLLRSPQPVERRGIVVSQLAAHPRR